MAFPDPAVGFVRARAAYQRAFARVGLCALWPVAILVPLALMLHTPATPWRIAIAGGVLAVALAVTGWRGGAWRRAALPGVLGGLPAFFVPSLLMPSEATCARCVGASSHWVSCMTACAIASLASGLALAYLARRDRDPRSFAASAALCAGATAALTCALAGGAGLLGVTVGLALASAPVLVSRGRAAA